MKTCAIKNSLGMTDAAHFNQDLPIRHAIVVVAWICFKNEATVTMAVQVFLDQVSAKNCTIFCHRMPDIYITSYVTIRTFSYAVVTNRPYHKQASTLHGKP